MIDVIEAALDVALNYPAIWHTVPSPIRPLLQRQDGPSDMLCSPVAAAAGSKPVRDVPELRLEDRLQDVLDRGLNDAIGDRRNAQGSELPWFSGLRDELAS